jgi:hypothetical protein
VTGIKSESLTTFIGISKGWRNLLQSIFLAVKAAFKPAKLCATIPCDSVKIPDSPSIRFAYPLGSTCVQSEEARGVGPHVHWEELRGLKDHGTGVSWFASSSE